MMKKILIIALLLILILSGWFVFKLFTYKYIAIEFKQLRPIHENVDVFYKGLKVGYVRKMELCHECKSTMVKVVLTYQGLMLPENTTAKMKKEKKHDKEFDFIELDYPEKPSDKMIANGSVLQGKTTIDIVSFMSNQDPDDLEMIKANLTQSSEELMTVLSVLGDLFSSMNEVVIENKKNLSDSSYNMSQTTRSLKQITSKFDNAIKQQELNESVFSLSETAKSFQSITGNLNGTTSSLNSATIPQVQSTLYKTECLVGNVNEMACGIKETLKKPFGGFRLIFGKALSSQNVKHPCPNTCRP